ncbi:unnamed protein product [Amoebophrya sp. A120]|nr:unnamed protein product [Amoebophrya sp. A120]|eukprot:GSA120T00025232001.1
MVTFRVPRFVRLCVAAPAQWAALDVLGAGMHEQQPQRQGSKNRRRWGDMYGDEEQDEAQAVEELLAYESGFSRSPSDEPAEPAAERASEEDDTRSSRLASAPALERVAEEIQKQLAPFSGTSRWCGATETPSSCSSTNPRPHMASSTRGTATVSPCSSPRSSVPASSSPSGSIPSPTVVNLLRDAVSMPEQDELWFAEGATGNAARGGNKLSFPHSSRQARWTRGPGRSSPGSFSTVCGAEESLACVFADELEKASPKRTSFLRTCQRSGDEFVAGCLSLERTNSRFFAAREKMQAIYEELGLALDHFRRLEQRQPGFRPDKATADLHRRVRRSRGLLHEVLHGKRFLNYQGRMYNDKGQLHCCATKEDADGGSQQSWMLEEQRRDEGVLQPEGGRASLGSVLHPLSLLVQELQNHDKLRLSELQQRELRSEQPEVRERDEERQETYYPGHEPGGGDEDERAPESGFEITATPGDSISPTGAVSTQNDRAARYCSVEGPEQDRPQAGPMQKDVDDKLAEWWRCRFDFGCKPCIFHRTKGCEQGAACMFCHTCTAEDQRHFYRLKKTVRHKISILQRQQRIAKIVSEPKKGKKAGGGGPTVSTKNSSNSTASRFGLLLGSHRAPDYTAAAQLHNYSAGPTGSGTAKKLGSKSSERNSHDVIPSSVASSSKASPSTPPGSFAPPTAYHCGPDSCALAGGGGATFGQLVGQGCVLAEPPCCFYVYQPTNVVQVPYAGPAPSTTLGLAVPHPAGGCFVQSHCPPHAQEHHVDRMDQNSQHVNSQGILNTPASVVTIAESPATGNLSPWRTALNREAHPFQPATRQRVDSADSDEALRLVAQVSAVKYAREEVQFPLDAAEWPKLPSPKGRPISLQNATAEKKKAKPDPR